MKILNVLIPSALLVIGVGCQSNETRTASQTTVVSEKKTEASAPQPAPAVAAQPESTPTSAQEIKAGNFTYTIEVIPNPHLTATSREGDNPRETKAIYSSNIIAVYVHTNNAVTVSSTNLSALGSSASSSQK